MISAILARSGGPPVAVVDHLGRFTEERWTDRGRRDQAERLDVGRWRRCRTDARRRGECTAPVPARPRSASCRRSRSARRRCHRSRLFVFVVAVGRSCQALPARNDHLEGSDAAPEFSACDQEAHAEPAQADGLIGRIDCGHRRPWPAPARAGKLRQHGRGRCSDPAADICPARGPGREGGIGAVGGANSWSRCCWPGHVLVSL